MAAIHTLILFFPHYNLMCVGSMLFQYPEHLPPVRWSGMIKDFYKMPKHLCKRKTLKKTVALILFIFFISGLLHWNTLSSINAGNVLFGGPHLETISSNTNSMEIIFCENTFTEYGMSTRRSVPRVVSFNPSFLSANTIVSLSDFVSRIFALLSSSRESHNTKNALYRLKTVVLRN